jgi:hypothetical protein
MLDAAEEIPTLQIAPTLDKWGDTDSAYRAK